MFCYYCGKEINDNSEFCIYCGNPVDKNGNNQQMTAEHYYEEAPVYEENLRRRPEKTESSNKNVMLLVCITVLSLIICVLIAILVINAGNNDNKTDTDVATDIPVITAEPTKEAEEYLYYVRTTPYDESSQIGSYDSFAKAREIADEYRYEGYKVYDSEGNLLYTPLTEQTQNVTPTQEVVSTQKSTGKANYRVRKSPYDSDSQLGAYEFFDNAKKMADKNKAAGYEVYDMKGNLIYIP